jgi:hypothetical protein
MFCQGAGVRQRQLPFAAKNHRAQGAVNAQGNRPVRAPGLQVLRAGGRAATPGMINAGWSDFLSGGWRGLELQCLRRGTGNLKSAIGNRHCETEFTIT